MNTAMIASFVYMGLAVGIDIINSKMDKKYDTVNLRFMAIWFACGAIYNLLTQQ